MMLWYKAWRESRVRFLLTVAVWSFLCVGLMYRARTAFPPPERPDLPYSAWVWANIYGNMNPTVFIILVMTWSGRSAARTAGWIGSIYAEFARYPGAPGECARRGRFVAGLGSELHSRNADPDAISTSCPAILSGIAGLAIRTAIYDLGLGRVRCWFCVVEPLRRGVHRHGIVCDHTSRLQDFDHCEFDAARTPGIQLCELHEWSGLHAEPGQGPN